MNTININRKVADAPAIATWNATIDVTDNAILNVTNRSTWNANWNANWWATDNATFDFLEEL